MPVKLINSEKSLPALQYQGTPRMGNLFYHRQKSTVGGLPRGIIILLTLLYQVRY
jgi:hypothetical protein